MSGFSIDPTTQTCYIGTVEEVQPQNVQKNIAEKAIPMVEEQKTTDVKDNTVLTSELTVENFKESMEREFGCSFNNIDDDAIIERFEQLLKKLSDKEKAEKFQQVKQDFASKPILIAEFIKSVKDKKLAAECADKIEYEIFINLDEKTMIDIASCMSKDKFLEYYQQINTDFNEFYNSDKENIDRVIDKLKNGETLVDENEIKIQEKLKNYHELLAILKIGRLENKNLSKQDNEELDQFENQIIQQYPPAFYDLYVQSLAEFVTRHQDSLSIDKDKLTEMLNKATDNKFSEKVKEIEQKSAVDTDGKFKQAPEEIIKKSEEKIKEIKQAIIETSAPQETTEEETKKYDIGDTDIVNYEAITGNDGIAIIKDVFAGKIKISDYLEKTAIKQYKLMDAAIQGDMLLNASGKFFNDLVKNTKSSTLENLLAIGWKGKSYDATQKVKNEAEERKDDVA